MMSDQIKQELFAQMHTLLDAGMDMTRMFDILREEYKDRKEARLLLEMYESIVQGMTLKDAMIASGEFTDLDFNVIGVGEISGKLSYTLRFLSGYYTKKATQLKAVRSALSYPIMILCFAIVVLCFMLMVIVPTFSQVYSRMGGDLPALTKVLIRMSSNAPVVFSISVAVVSVLTLFCWYHRHSEDFQRLKSSILLAMPVVSRIVKYDAQCTFCRLMDLLTSSGVSMLESLDMVSRSMKLQHYRMAIIDMTERIKGGASLSSCMSAYGSLFSRKMTALLRVGEESHRLGEMFNRSADLLSDSLDTSFKSLSTYIEPVMVILVGGIVALILIAMYLPMFRLGMVISG